MKVTDGLSEKKHNQKVGVGRLRSIVPGTTYQVIVVYT